MTVYTTFGHQELEMQHVSSPCCCLAATAVSMMIQHIKEVVASLVFVECAEVVEKHVL